MQPREGTETKMKAKKSRTSSQNVHFVLMMMIDDKTNRAPNDSRNSFNVEIK